MNNLNSNIIKNNQKAKMKKIAIIGAGYTGLMIAYRLSQKGYKVTIFEKEDFVGGLTSGFELDDIPLEKIWHFLYLSDNYALDLAEELEVKDKLVFHNSTVSTYYDGKLYPFMSPKDLLFFSPISILSRIRTGLVGLYLKLLNNWHPLTKITAYDWMNKWGGREATKVIWKPLLEGKFGKYYDKVIMSWLWGRIKVRVDSQESSGEQLGYFKGGFSVLTNGLKNSIGKNSGQIKLNSEIKTIANRDGQIVIETGEGAEVFDKVAVTTASPVFANLIEKNEEIKQSYLNKLRSIDYVGAIVMTFSSSQKISPYYWHNVNDEKIPFLVFLANSELAGPETYQGKHIYYIGFYAEHGHHYFEEDKDKIMTEWLQGVKKMFPDFSEEKITDKNLFKFKNAQHIVDLNYKSRIPAYQTPLENVYLSNFSQIYPEDRGLNFAIRDGERIAEMIMKER